MKALVLSGGAGTRRGPNNQRNAGLADGVANLSFRIL